MIASGYLSEENKITKDICTVMFIATLFKIANIWSHLSVHQGFPDSSVGKESPAMQETPVWSLGWEDPLEKG